MATNAITFQQRSLLSVVKAQAGTKTFRTTPAIAYFDGRSVDATGKALHRLADLGLVIRKGKGYGTQARYQWRLSARGAKAI